MNMVLSKNLKIKFSSFGIALVFWFIIVTANNYSYEVDIKLQVKNIPVGKIIVNVIPRRVKIKLEGEGKNLFSLLFFEDAAVSLDLSGIKDRVELPITPDMVDLPRLSHAMQVQSVLYPTTIKIILDDLINKKVPVRHNISCEPLEGYTLVGAIKVEPDSITLSGPRSILNNIDEIATEPRVLFEQHSSFMGNIALEIFPDSLKIRAESKMVNYTGDVQKLLEYEIPEIPIHVLNKPRHTEVLPLPSSASVTVVGGENYLINLKPENFYLFVDYNQAHKVGADNAGKGLSIQYKTMSDVEIVRIFPNYVILEKRKKK